MIQSSFSGSSRLLGGININLPSPLSIPNQSSSSPSSWASSFSDFQNPEVLASPSSNSNPYGGASSNGFSNLTTGSSSSTMNSSSPPFYGRGEADLIDEFQLQDQFSFLNDGPKNSDLYYPPPDLASSPNASRGDGMNFPYAIWVSSTNSLPHRRSCSVSNISAEDPAGGFGWKPCLYFARGY
ncbi:unnamed protein product [Ilex paraguariensis]|uniref:Uncharacterized protein n=1 Tax=Ilex paraguariensis TaxID=185542 RepID=A0ABC8QVD2_9AQUA